MSQFILSGFADEIDADFGTQLNGLQELGIGHIEIRGVNGSNISTLSAAQIAEVKRQLESSGIRVSSIGSPVGKIQITDDFNPHLDMFKRIMDTAHTLHSPYIRVFSFYIPEGQDAAQYRNEVIDRMGAIVETAKGSGVMLVHENEKHIYGDTAERCLDLMTTLKADHWASAFDPANFIQCDVEVFPKAFELLKPYIKYVHIKDAQADGQVVPAGYGTGRVEDVLRTLKADGYEGFLSLEPHLGSFKGLAQLEHTDWVDSLEQGGLHTFRVAHRALQAILNRI
ncbi:xylose isomerase [Paenibacillus sp. CCS19]|nr:xylose isomerase [Paenibacillus cellulosilyticus]